MKSITFLFLALGTASCMKPDAEKLNKDGSIAYFDLKGFVATQTEVLTKNHASLDKNVLVNGQPESFQLNTVEWQKELRPFANADINKPVLVGAYQMVEFFEGNKQFTAYEALAPDREVKRLLIVKEQGQIVEIDIDFSEDNPIYHSMRKMKMLVESGKLSYYSVSGFQKLTLDDTLRYELTAKVQLNNMQ